MISNRRSPLTPLAQDALDTLANALPSKGELTYEQAYAILKDREELEQPAAEDIIERLYLQGHIYEVEGKIHPRDERAFRTVLPSRTRSSQ